MTATVQTRILEGFDDPTFGPDQWDSLLQRTGTDNVYLTWQWQRAWWEAFGKGNPFLIVVERQGRVVALAPLYVRSGMVYFIGAAYWEADRLDFIGDVGDPQVLQAIIETAREAEPELEGFKFEFVPAQSPTARGLESVAERLDIPCYLEWDQEAAIRDLVGDPTNSADRRSLRKLENYFRRDGSFHVEHLRDGAAILPHLPEFFAQHVERWTTKANASLLGGESHCAFYEHLTQLAAHTGWLRFTRIQWNGRPIAFHYGYSYNGRYVWNASSFALDLADRSPGQVLLRQLFLEAAAERCHTFDFGTGDQPFKLRFANRITSVQGWGLYPHSESSGQQSSKGTSAVVPLAGAFSNSGGGGAS